MTCVIGWCDEEKMIMGADSATSFDTGGYNVMTCRNPKVVKLRSKNGFELLIGSCGQIRPGNLLSILEPPICDLKWRNQDEAWGYVMRKFIPVVKELFGDEPMTKEGEDEGCFILGCAGLLFEISYSLSVDIVGADFHAVGSGGHIAMGAMSAFTKIGFKDPEEMLLKALEISEKYNREVRRPFTCVKVLKPIEG